VEESVPTTLAVVVVVVHADWICVLMKVIVEVTVILTNP